MKPSKQPSRSYQAGFSLVEIMVGLVIGLLATLVIMQVFSVFEGQKRTTTGVADAQINGSIALYSLGRDLQMAGYGLLPLGLIDIADSPIECTALNIDGPNTGFDPASGIAAISPVIITDGSTMVPASLSDSITIHYGSSNMGGIPSSIRGATGSISVETDLGCEVNDIALIFQANNCALESVSGVVASTPASGAVAAGLAQISLKGAMPAEAVIDANMACLGTWNEITYQVNNGILERVSNGTAVPIIAGIVNIQAQYGIADPASAHTANENKVIQWVDASNATGWDAPTVNTPPTGIDRNLIKAVRIAIVARNGLLEREVVTQDYTGKACDSLTGNEPHGVCAWSATSLSPQVASPAPEIDLSDDPGWQHYRYRVFETVIPLRNIIWSRSTL